MCIVQLEKLETWKAYKLSRMLFIYRENTFYLINFTHTYDGNMPNNSIL